MHYKEDMMQLTIRQVPAELKRRLERQAADWGISVNKAAVRILQEKLAPDKAPYGKKRDLSRFKGIWSEDEAKRFREGQHDFERIDDGL